MAEKWDLGPFLPFLGHFSAHFPGEARSHFSAIFARFRAQGPKAVCSRSTGSKVNCDAVEFCRVQRFESLQWPATAIAIAWCTPIFLPSVIAHRPLNGPFRGAVFRHGGGALKQPIKQPTEMPTSTTALMGRFPSLMGRFPTLMGRFTDFVPRGRFTS